MIPPTSIDGTDITGATIDGTDVQEITVDGQTVFTAETLPVAYSNLVAWYPFDSATYGGSNADDVTALFNPGQSGDSTAYDGTVNGATYQSSGGVTDINAGANSGAFDFDGSDDLITISTSPFVDQSTGSTVTFWLDFDGGSNKTALRFFWDFTSSNDGFVFKQGSSGTFFVGNSSRSMPSIPTGLSFFAVRYDNGYDIFRDATLIDSESAGTNLSNDIIIGNDRASASGPVWDGRIDDVRVYDTPLTNTEINSIYVNTQP